MAQELQMMDLLSIVGPWIYAAFILLATWVVARLVGTALWRALRVLGPMIAVHVRKIITVGIWAIGILLAIGQLGLRIDVLLLLVGLVGAGAILAVKDILQNMASRYFSEVYVPCKIGDTIRVAGYEGKVIEINPITTILVTEDERLVSVPNSFFVRETVVNTTPMAWRELIIPIVVGSDTDLPEFESKVINTCNKLRMHLDERFPPILAVKNRSENEIQLSLTLMIRRPEKKEALAAEINKRIAEIIESMRHRAS